MRILIANDDGYLAPGLAALVQACDGLGRARRGGAGAERERHVELADAQPAAVGVHRAQHFGTEVETFRYINGTPSDCVHVALTGLLEHRPDLVVSGINNGANMGDDTLYSGTVAAAMEGYLFGIPAIAFSQVEKGWGATRRGVRGSRGRSSSRCWRGRRRRRHWLLNVNIPNRADADALPRKVTRLGRRHASEPMIRQTSPRGEAIYWIGPAGDAREAGEGTDFHATASGAVSITPLQVDLTEHASLAEWAAWVGKAGA